MNLLDEYGEEELLKLNANFITLNGVRLKKKDWIKDRGFRKEQLYIYKPCLLYTSPSPRDRG